MLSELLWLALEAKNLDTPKEFYSEKLNLNIEKENENEVEFSVGNSKLILRKPSSIPRGGVHTHFAFSTGDYEKWYSHLEDKIIEERNFGGNKSMYFYDPIGNCVEIGDRGKKSCIDGIFEIVLEIEDLQKSISFYKNFGMESFNSKGKRERERLWSSAVELELWKPHLGIAEGQGGIHVDIGFKVSEENIQKIVKKVSKEALSVEEINEGIRIKDPDGHYITLVS